MNCKYSIFIQNRKTAIIYLTFPLHPKATI